MRKPSFTRQFSKDLKKIKRQGKNTDKLKAVMSDLIDEKQLGKRYHDHKLTGNFKDRRECHLEPDWLLIYKIENDKILFERTGSHSELF
ncbi:type II toxin-antitoxin system YafQ family toxin [bacterium]|nr:type II toxin-antitoxin system YafQ family toxin [bacterium]